MTGQDELPADAPKPGAIFAGKYRIERLIGTGGMGYVLAAKHLQLDERVAIKLLLREEAARPEAVARFLREARASVKIRSEHIVRVLDVGEEGDTPYIVMEYLSGSDLAAVLAARQSLPQVLAVDYLLQACEAVAEAHALGIVHRDLKPANLFVVQRPDGSEHIKVLDFGISKMMASGPDAVSMTATNSTFGTPLYMSPEQLKSSKNVDTRTDIWAFGVILFELLAGRPPFLAESIAELGAQVLREDAPDVRTLVPDVPEGLARAIATCLERNLAKRLSTLADVAAALAPFGSDGARASSRGITGVLARVSSSRNLPAVATVPRLQITDSTWTGEAHSAASGAARTSMGAKQIAVGLGVLALLMMAGGVGGAFLWRGLQHAPAPEIESPLSASTHATPGAGSILAEQAPPVPSAPASASSPAVATPAPPATATATPSARPRGALPLASKIDRPAASATAALRPPAPESSGGFSKSRYE